MKAQVWSLDFAASVVIFLTAIIVAMFALNFTMAQNAQQTEFNIMENAAMSVSDSLVRLPGMPDGWNRTTVTTIGLASQENILNGTKLEEFVAMDNDTVKNLLGTGNYQLYFELRYVNGTLATLPGGGQASRGAYPSGAALIIPVQRYVLYMERPARMMLILWT